MRLLVTGAAGFIGYHTARALLERGEEVAGLDDLNAYYDVRLKEARRDRLKAYPRFRFITADLADRAAIERAFSEGAFHRIVHLGAQAGVRYSLDNPHAYVSANVTGFLNVLEGCRTHRIEHLVYASSSSVYGANTTTPFAAHHHADHPLSLYAATKRANELMAHAYAHLYAVPVTGLRFFTVYGPWGRPDMALFKFTKAMLANEPIDVFNNGHHARDFTFIDDAVEAVVRTLDRPPKPDPDWSSARPDPAGSAAPYRLYNVGNSRPVGLMELIASLEKALGRTADKTFSPLQPGDVAVTYADVSTLMRDVGFKPMTTVDDGVKAFVDWYRQFYRS